MADSSFFAVRMSVYCPDGQTTPIKGGVRDCPHKLKIKKRMSPETPCVHRYPMVPVGEIRDHGECVNQDLACSLCGAIVGESSTRKGDVMAKKTGKKRGRKKKQTLIEEIDRLPNVDAPASGDQLDLGPVLLPSAEDALKVLGELADLNDQAIQAQKVYLDRKEAAHKAKTKWDDLAVQVQDKLRLATHASGLPLFDAGEREGDQIQMEAAIDAAVDRAFDEPTDPLKAAEVDTAF
jgi:hypothetical protein